MRTALLTGAVTKGSFLPTDYVRSQPRAATAPAGAKRTLARLQSVEIGEDSFLSVHRVCLIAWA